MSYREYLKHILDETEFLSQKVARIDKNHFLNDEVLKRAFVRSLEVIGEATKKLPDDVRDKYSNTD